MNTPRALQLYYRNPPASYSIDEVASRVGVPRRWVALCCKYGFVSATAEPQIGGWYFPDEAVGAVRKVAALRALCGGSFAGARRILELEAELERVRAELDFWRQGS